MILLNMLFVVSTDSHSLWFVSCLFLNFWSVLLNHLKSWCFLQKEKGLASAWSRFWTILPLFQDSRNKLKISSSVCLSCWGQRPCLLKRKSNPNKPWSLCEFAVLDRHFSLWFLFPFPFWIHWRSLLLGAY